MTPMYVYVVVGVFPGDELYVFADPESAATFVQTVGETEGGGYCPEVRQEPVLDIGFVELRRRLEA